MNARGQIEGYDIIVSIFIFLILFSFAHVLWQDRFFSSVAEREFTALRIDALRVSDQLAMTPGAPANWHMLSDYNRVGLASDPRVLSKQRITAFQNADYNALKAGLVLEGRDYYVSLVQAGKRVFEKGVQLTTASAHVDRIVVYNNDAARLGVAVYE